MAAIVTGGGCDRHPAVATIRSGAKDHVVGESGTAHVQFVTATAVETRALGEALASLLGPGDVVALSGDLGAGKTCLVQGVARGLGIDRVVTSPTFMLQRSYQGRELLVHLDVYRLDRLQDVLDLGDDAMAPDVVTVVEWGDTIASLLPDDRLDVHLVHRGDPGDAVMDDVDGQLAAEEGRLVDLPRTVEVALHGRWRDRHDEVAAVAVTLLDPDTRFGTASATNPDPGNA